MRCYGFVMRLKLHIHLQTSILKKQFLPFPSSYLNTCSFSAENYLLLKEKIIIDFISQNKYSGV